MNFNSQDSFLFTGAKQCRWYTLFAGAKQFQTANNINQEGGHINNGRSKYVIRTISDKIMYKSQQNHEFIARIHGLVLIRQQSIAARMKNLQENSRILIRNRKEAEQGSDQ